MTTSHQCQPGKSFNLSGLASSHNDCFVKSTDTTSTVIKLEQCEKATDLASLAVSHKAQSGKPTDLASLAASHKAQSGKPTDLASLAASHKVQSGKSIDLDSLAASHKAHSGKPTDLASLAASHKVQSGKPTDLASLAASHKAQSGKPTDLASLAMSHKAQSVKPTDLASLAASHKVQSGKPADLASLASLHEAQSEKPTDLASLAASHKAQLGKPTDLASLAASHKAQFGKPTDLASLSASHKAQCGKPTDLASLAASHKAQSGKAIPTSNFSLSSLSNFSANSLYSESPPKSPNLASLAASFSSSPQNSYLSELEKDRQISLISSVTHERDGMTSSDIALPESLPKCSDPKVHLSEIQSVSSVPIPQAPPGFSQAPSVPPCLRPAVPPGFSALDNDSPCKVPAGKSCDKNSTNSEAVSSSSGVSLSKLAALHGHRMAGVRRDSENDMRLSTSSSEHMPVCISVQTKALSVFGIVMCLNQTKAKKNTGKCKSVQFKHPKFSYNRQVTKCVEVKKKMDVVPFDFSTPSPDDFVKKKQAAAFTRSGNGQRGSITEGTDHRGSPPCKVDYMSQVTAMTGNSPVKQPKAKPTDAGARMSFL